VRSEEEIREVLAAAQEGIAAHALCEVCGAEPENTLLDIEHVLSWVLGDQSYEGDKPTHPLVYGLSPLQAECVRRLVPDNALIQRELTYNRRVSS
jgi:hypothetical protein